MGRVEALRRGGRPRAPAWAANAQAHSRHARLLFARLVVWGMALPGMFTPKVTDSPAAELAVASEAVTPNAPPAIPRSSNPSSKTRVAVRCDREHQIIPLELAAPLLRDPLWLQVHDLQALSPRARFRRGVSEAQLGEDVVIEFPELPGAQLVLRLISNARGLSLRVTGRFREQATHDVELTYARVQRAEVTARASLSHARARISQLAASLKSAEKLLQSAHKRPAWNSHQEQQKQLAILQLNGNLRAIRRRLRHAQEQSTGAAARLAAVPRVTALLQAIDGRPISFRVVARGAGSDRVLLDIGAGTEAQEGADSPLPPNDAPRPATGLDPDSASPPRI